MGPLFRWRKALSDLTCNGRDATFSTEFTWEKGLEVVQPNVYGFTVQPTNTCAETNVHVTWDAANNPPGTIPTIELRPPGVIGPPVRLVTLPNLQGTQDV